MLRKLSTSLTMPKKNSTSKNVASVKSDPGPAQNGCVFADKKGNIMIKILAKPGSKTNQITGIVDEGIGVQINAPPVDGEANTELIKYFAVVLDVRKSDLCLDKGSRSRQKILQLSPGIITVDQVLEKLKNAVEK